MLQILTAILVSLLSQFRPTCYVWLGLITTFPGLDYRKIPHALAKVYFDPIDYENKQALEEIWDTLTSHTKILRNDTINVWGHKLRIPESTSTGIARFTFDDLCGRPLGAADYIEITQKYNTLFVTDVPKLTLNHKDKVRASMS